MKTTETEDFPDVPVNHLDLPVGKMISPPVRGECLALPLFGWIARRVGDRVPLVMLALLLIRSLDEPDPIGTLEVTLPCPDRNLLATARALERFGWAGGQWPQDPGWLAGDSQEEAAVRALLDQAGLKSSLTFPPGPNGVAMLDVNVARASGPYLMPPLILDSDPDPYLVEKLRTLLVS